MTRTRDRDLHVEGKILDYSIRGPLTPLHITLVQLLKRNSNHLLDYPTVVHASPSKLYIRFPDS
jgi:hypothetical protein